MILGLIKFEQTGVAGDNGQIEKSRRRVFRYLIESCPRTYLSPYSGSVVLCGAKMDGVFADRSASAFRIRKGEMACAIPALPRR